MMAEVTRENMELLSNVRFGVGVYSGAEWELIKTIAQMRLQSLLCDDTLTLDNIPEDLLPVVADLLVWIVQNKPSDYGIKSETAENYSYTRSDTDTSLNQLVRLRSKYGDVIAKYSKCVDPDGSITNARHNPLWTADYYRESGGIQ